MKMLIDTFSWKKIEILEDDMDVGMEKSIDRFTVCITHSVLEEINHFNIALHYLKKISVVPHKENKIYNDARLFGFDEADASMLSLSIDDTDNLIISEDRPLLTFGKGYGLKIVQLIDFFRIMAMMDIVSGKDLYKINRKLREMKNISKSKEKSIREWLKSHSIDSIDSHG